MAHCHIGITLLPGERCCVALLPTVLLLLSSSGVSAMENSDAATTQRGKKEKVS
jgi:hypothetical protein